MKKFVSFGLLCTAFLSLGILSCGGNNNVPPSQTEKDKFSVTFDDSDFYEVSGLKESYNEGENVTFTVEPVSVFYEINSVTADNVKINETFSGYSFVMPSSDVKLLIEVDEITSFDDPSDKLSWGSTVIDEISVASESDKDVSWEVTQELPLVFDGITSSNFITSIKSTILSSNQDVMPNEAIKFTPLKASNSNSIIGGELSIDLKQIKPGQTSIYVDLDPNNSSLGALIRQFTVVEYGEINLPTIPVTLNVKNETKFDDEGIFLNISDLNYVYGSKGKQIASVYLSELIDGKYTFDYFVGHQYRITSAYMDEDKNQTALTINEWVGEGSSSTGFNEYKDGILTMLTEGVVDVVLEEN